MDDFEFVAFGRPGTSIRLKEFSTRLEPHKSVSSVREFRELLQELSVAA
ncbi:hypothetical protein [Streptomyces sp. NPDC013455]